MARDRQGNKKKGGESELIETSLDEFDDPECLIESENKTEEDDDSIDIKEADIGEQDDIETGENIHDSDE